MAATRVAMARTSASLLLLSCLLLPSIITSNFRPYRGPVQSLSRIEHGVQAGDLGITLMVGPSSFLQGSGEKGLFISVCEDVETALLPANSIMCGYSKGAFQDKAEGDKCVGYAFTDCSTGVIYNKQVTSLAEVLIAIRDEKGVAELKQAILGHTIHAYKTDDKRDGFTITPDPGFRERYFVPFSDQQEFGAINFGMFSNDLQANPNPNPSKGKGKGSGKGKGDGDGYTNILQLIWRLSWDEGRGCAVPTWPVLILAEDLLIENREPMEVGVTYGQRYWGGTSSG